MNQVNLIGNTTREIEFKAVSETFDVAKVGIAINKRFKDKNGDKQEKVEYVNLVAFNHLAKLFRDYVKKGDKIRVTGELQTRSWDKEGEKRYATEVVVNELEFLPSAKKSEAPNDSQNFDDSFPTDPPY